MFSEIQMKPGGIYRVTAVYNDDEDVPEHFDTKRWEFECELGIVFLGQRGGGSMVVLHGDSLEVPKD